MIKTLLLLVGVTASQYVKTSKQYKYIFYNVCFWLDYAPPMIAQYALVNEITCAARCSMNSQCFLYHVNFVNNTCLLYPILVWTQVANKSSVQPGVCRTSITESWQRSVQQGGQLFTSSGSFTVPDGIESLRIVAIGGGGGAYYSNSGGGGSGFVVFKNVSVVPKQQYAVVVGAGGLGSNSTAGAATNGQASSFGNLVEAKGGSATTNRLGRNGGSGGGGGANYSSFSGSGGACGANGSFSGDGRTGGTGQGQSFSNWFSYFKFATFTCGAGGQGVVTDSANVIGGGGGGGLLVNGSGIQGGGNLNCNGVSGPSRALGYGAGGSSGCLPKGGNYGLYYVNSVAYTGGCGAPGLVYVEY